MIWKQNALPKIGECRWRAPSKVESDVHYISVHSIFKSVNLVFSMCIMFLKALNQRALLSQLPSHAGPSSGNAFDLGPYPTLMEFLTKCDRSVSRRIIGHAGYLALHPVRQMEWLMIWKLSKLLTKCDSLKM